MCLRRRGCADECSCCTAVRAHITITSCRRCSTRQPPAGAQRELFFYDQRGGGRSRSDSTSARRPRHLADARRGSRARLIAELGTVPLTLVGYSWGGLLAMLYAREAAAGHVATCATRAWCSSIRRPSPAAFANSSKPSSHRRQSSVEVGRFATSSRRRGFASATGRVPPSQLRAERCRLLRRSVAPRTTSRRSASPAACSSRSGKASATSICLPPGPRDRPRTADTHRPRAAGSDSARVVRGVRECPSRYIGRHRRVRSRAVRRTADAALRRDREVPRPTARPMLTRAR